MSETLIYIIIFAALMFFMHRGHGGHGGHGGMGGCGGHSHHGQGEKKTGSDQPAGEESQHTHHH